MIEILRGAVAVVLTFSFAIFIHELGHFMFAKLFKVRVETFSIGFGKKLWSRRRGETEYAISAIPFGGYVKLVGMHSKEMEELLEGDKAKPDASAPPQLPGEDGVQPGQIPAGEALREAVEPGPAQQEPVRALGESVVEEISALRSKSWLQKMLIFSAGCINNFLTAVVVFFLLAWIGHYQQAPIEPVVEAVRYAAPERAGVQPGDRIVRMAGEPVESYEEFVGDFIDYAEKNPAMQSVELQVLRDGTTATAQLPLRYDPNFPPAGEMIVSVAGSEVSGERAVAKAAAKTLDRKNPAKTVEVVTSTADGQKKTYQVSPLAVLGRHWIEVAFEPTAPTFIGGVLPNLPADRAGLKAGDRILAIDGVPVTSAMHATAVLRDRVDQTVPVQIQRGDETKTLAVDVRSNPENPEVGQIGIAWGTPRTEWYQKPFGEAFTGAFKAAGNVVVAYWNGIQELLASSFQTVRENVGGPIQIGTMFYSAANQDAVYFFNLFAFFNIILAVTNLLPLPVFDGGHIVIATIEAIIRRPLPAKVMMYVFNVFIVLIIGLALLISVNDVIMNLWRIKG